MGLFPSLLLLGNRALTVWHATAMNGLRMAVVTETMWSMTPSSSGLVTLAMWKMWRTVSDRRFRQPRGSWALPTSDASGGHSWLREREREAVGVGGGHDINPRAQTFMLPDAPAAIQGSGMTDNSIFRGTMFVSHAQRHAETHQV